MLFSQIHLKSFFLHFRNDVFLSPSFFRFARDCFCAFWEYHGDFSCLVPRRSLMWNDEFVDSKNRLSNKLSFQLAASWIYPRDFFSLLLSDFSFSSSLGRRHILKRCRQITSTTDTKGIKNYHLRKGRENDSRNPGSNSKHCFLRKIGKLGTKMSHSLTQPINSPKNDSAQLNICFSFNKRWQVGHRVDEILPLHSR